MHAVWPSVCGLLHHSARTVLSEVANGVDEGRNGALAVPRAAPLRAASRLGQRVDEAKHAEHAVHVGGAGVQQLRVGALLLRVLVDRVGHALQGLQRALRGGLGRGVRRVGPSETVRVHTQ